MRSSLPDQDERLNWPVDAESGVEGEAAAAWDPIRVENPLSSQHSVLRRDVIGSLLDVVSRNLRQGREDVAIFEIGKGYGLVGGQAARVVAPRHRGDRRRGAAVLEPARSARTTSTT